MSIPPILSDSYERKARLYPALLLLLPIALATGSVVAASVSLLKSLVPVAITCGGAFLLTELARDAGKRREPELFAEWGGVPSVAIFRHRDSRIDAITKTRYHRTLASLVKTTTPSPADESRDSAQADEVYTAWSSYLRTHTRDTKKYPLIFRENVSYGYRRNVLGLRPIGITICSVSLGVIVLWSAFQMGHGASMKFECLGAGGIVLVFLALWLFRFTEHWVRIPADAYAARLAEAADTVAPKNLEAGNNRVKGDLKTRVRR